MLSEDYAHGRASAIDDATQRAAYLAVRLPATYAAVRAALAMTRTDVGRDVTSLLDVGAGPGTATWAAVDSGRFPELRQALLVDRSRAWLDTAERLAAGGAATSDVRIATRVFDARRDESLPDADLVIAAYALAELDTRAVTSLVERLWSAAGMVLVLVEPGTPAGFERLCGIRTRLIGQGATVAAPCPHEDTCPMAGDDWCHFAVRVPRSRLHRQVKGGTLGYEDEKFSILVASKREGELTDAARVLRHPHIEKGRVRLELCTPEGATREVVTRHDPRYRAARRLAWGDGWER